ncbi:hypothetical protein [Sulfurimonas sp.]|uniref:hypothetical protein n=1 Tax=Sulfurimonas sp. TaxID=2022749 RepID=UPI002600C0BC|nr:hypothetical protein [Sulfurimonas sp.]
MTKLIQAILTGIFFTFILDFFVFLGIKHNYIDFYEIDLYYNILFADHQNIYFFAITSLVIGFIFTYINNTRLSFIVIGLLSVVSLSTLIPTVGYSLGEKLLMKKNITYNDAKYTYVGDVYYDGRTQITFYDYSLEKTILLKKDLIK